MQPSPIPQNAPATRAPARGPVSATLTEVARHWLVDVETARRVLSAKGVQDQETHATPRYLWRDIRAIERAGVVAGTAWPDTTGPLLAARTVGADLGIDASTARRYVAAGRLAATRLGPRLLRFHPDLAPSSPTTEQAL